MAIDPTGENQEDELKWPQQWRHYQSIIPASQPRCPAQLYLSSSLRRPNSWTIRASLIFRAAEGKLPTDVRVFAGAIRDGRQLAGTPIRSRGVFSVNTP
jgi:hypothetical protein